MRSAELSVITFSAPYSDSEATEAITDHTRATVRGEIPAYQVDVGDDYHLAGTLATRAVIEAAVNLELGDALERHDYAPFQFTAQAMRAPHYIRPQHARILSLPPHLDRQQIGVALHKEYAGEPTMVQFGYARPNVAFPPVSDWEVYDGPDLEPFVDDLFTGMTQLGRLTIFAQGFKPTGMQAAAHYFERPPDQIVGGRWTRYYSPDSKVAHIEVPPTDPEVYTRFVAMRKEASLYLDYKQWSELAIELKGNGDQLDSAHRDELTQLAEAHMHTHPGAKYSYWEIQNNADMKVPFSYGVFGGEYGPDTMMDFVSRPLPPQE